MKLNSDGTVKTKLNSDGTIASAFDETRQDVLPPISRESWQQIHDSTPAELQDGADTYEGYLADNAANPMPRGMCGTTATNLMSRFMFNQQGVGTTPNVASRYKDANRSQVEQMMGGSLLSPDDDLPQGPGFAYFNHLFNRAGGKKRDEENKRKKMTKGSNIYTEAQEALKVAIKAMGVATSMNPTGLPIDIQDAMQIWFGDDDVGDDEKLQWRTSTEMGDARIDPKKVRKFTNYDGSMTWEILNDDKTVSSRFTLGEYAGTKIFSQGGYNKFVELMQKVKEQVGYDDSTSFDSIRGRY